MSGVIGVCYCSGLNFGDELNRYIFKKYLDMDVKYVNQEFAQILGIGSILDYVFLGKLNSFMPPLRIFSSGFPFEGRYMVFENRKPIRKLQVYALRGKNSLELMKMLTSDALEEVVLADGGLLASGLLAKQPCKEYELGIVPHYAEKDELSYVRLAEKIRGSVILNVEKNPLDFLCELGKCRRIISSALHPLIAADSLRIPNMWVRMHERTTSRYKFEDYYSAFDKHKRPVYVDDIDSNSLLEEIDSGYDIEDFMIDEKKCMLEKSMRQLKLDMEEERRYWY